MDPRIVLPRKFSLSSNSPSGKWQCHFPSPKCTARPMCRAFPKNLLYLKIVLPDFFRYQNSFLSHFLHGRIPKYFLKKLILSARHIGRALQGADAYTAPCFLFLKIPHREMALSFPFPKKQGTTNASVPPPKVFAI